MLSDIEYVRQSLEVNLFFMRIAKEHAFFIETAIPAKNCTLIQEAEMLKNEFEILLTEAVRLVDGFLSPEFLASGQIVTRLTLDAERLSEFYSGYNLNTTITRMELSLGGNGANPNLASTVDRVNLLNQQANCATRRLIDYKAKLLNDVLTCRVFTFNYPLLLDHILREARFYLNTLERIQNRIEVNPLSDAIQQEAFWNRIMAEHSKFIRGLVDPTEVELFTTADNFGRQFDILTMQAEALAGMPGDLSQVTQASETATTAIRDFKVQGTEGLIRCEIRSIAHPLLGDHVAREANHYLWLLNIIQAGI